MSEQLKPCPFCGETPDLNDESGHYQIHDNKYGGIRCCIDGPEVRTGYKPWPAWQAEAVNAWNTRPDEDHAARMAVAKFQRQFIEKIKELTHETHDAEAIHMRDYIIKLLNKTL